VRGHHKLWQLPTAFTSQKISSRPSSQTALRRTHESKAGLEEFGEKAEGKRSLREIGDERTSYMKRYILTGTPGSGKTSILHELKRQGYSVVEEAATDVIAREQMLSNPEPWLQPDFIESIVHLQKQRQLEAATLPDELQWYDRSPICTFALSRYLGYAAPPSLVEEIERIEREAVYQRQVFFIENLGFCQPTEARKITFEESLIFENIHEETYASLGYDLLKIPLGALSERVHRILQWTEWTLGKR
jgi:predicted ATPase